MWLRCLNPLIDQFFFEWSSWKHLHHNLHFLLIVLTEHPNLPLFLLLMHFTTLSAEILDIMSKQTSMIESQTFIINNQSLILEQFLNLNIRMDQLDSSQHKILPYFRTNFPTPPPPSGSGVWCSSSLKTTLHIIYNHEHCFWLFHVAFYVML